MIDPRMDTVSSILKHVHKGTIENAYTILNGDYEVIEAEILESSDLINKELKQTQKYGLESDVTTRLRHTVTEVDGDNSKETILSFSQNMLARDSVSLRNYINDISPDIELEQEIELGGETVSVSIPLTVEFFWPKSIE